MRTTNSSSKPKQTSRTSSGSKKPASSPAPKAERAPRRSAKDSAELDRVTAFLAAYAQPGESAVETLQRVVKGQVEAGAPPVPPTGQTIAFTSVPAAAFVLCRHAATLTNSPVFDMEARYDDDEGRTWTTRLSEDGGTIVQCEENLRQFTRASTEKMSLERKKGDLLTLINQADKRIDSIRNRFDAVETEYARRKADIPYGVKEDHDEGIERLKAQRSGYEEEVRALEVQIQGCLARMENRKMAQMELPKGMKFEIVVVPCPSM